MSNENVRWGRGRVAFIADLTSIRSELSRAIPMTKIFAARKDRLGISYAAFCKLVARYAADARVKPVETVAPSADEERRQRNVRKTFDEHSGDASPALLRKLTSG